MPRAALRAGPLTAAVLVPLLGCGPAAGTPSSPAPSGATTPAITAADLRSRLYAYADDSMQGRRSGTPGNVKATDFIAAEARRIGLAPSIRPRHSPWTAPPSRRGTTWSRATRAREPGRWTARGSSTPAPGART